MKRSFWLLAILLSINSIAEQVRGQGAVLPGAGPINRSMGGAGVAAPLSAAGAIYWNPASMSGLQSSEMEFGSEFMYGTLRMSSSVPANSFGPGVPATDMAGNTRSDSGVFVIPTIALAYLPDDSPFGFGFGVFSAGGFSSNFPADPSNPLLSPPPPNGTGVGPIYSRFGLIQMISAVSAQLTDEVSFSLGPAVTAVDLATDPAFFAAPDDANGDTFATYPSGTHARMHWGLGFVAGMYVEKPNGVNYGISYKSPTWLETFKFRSQDEIGNPRTLELNSDFPGIISVGLGYTGMPCWTFALDVRYVDYDNAEGFGHDAGFDANGASTGIGWRSVFAVASGVQYEVTDTLSVRLGYLYTEKPFPDSNTFFNLQAPAFYQHVLSTGMSQNIGPIKMSVTYIHGINTAVDGPIYTPTGPVAGTNVKMSNFSHTLAVGMGVKF